MKRIADRQRASIYQLRLGVRLTQVTEVIQRHGLGEGRSVDRDRIGRRQSSQLISDDDGVIGRRRNGPGLPIRPIAPTTGRARFLRPDPDDGRGLGTRDLYSYGLA